SLHFLKPNLSKTELIIFPPPRASSPNISVRINSTTINPSLHARVRGGTMDSEISFQAHIQSIIHPFLTNHTAKLLIHSLVISHLNYCNSLLIGNQSLSSTPLYQSLHWPPFSVLHPSLPIPPLASIPCPPPLSANPSTGLHSVSSTPLCQSLHWPPFSVLHPSLPIPPVASIQCPPPLSANPSTGLYSVSSTPLCQSLHWPPFSDLHPSMPIPPLASIQ
ncbi:unnamed protein product, partial [Staurois parvus]